MAIQACAPCNCTPGTIGNDKFKQDVELILCAILSAQTDPVTPSASPTGLIAIDNQDIANAFADTGLLDSPWKSVYINNQTDGTLLFTFGSSSNDPQIRMLGNETRTLSFNPAAISGPLYVMYEEAPTLGFLYIEAWS